MVAPIRSVNSYGTEGVWDRLGISRIAIRILLLVVACAAGFLTFLGIVTSPWLVSRSMAAELHPSATSWALLSPTTWLTTTDPVTVTVQVTNEFGLIDGTAFFEWQGMIQAVSLSDYTQVSTQSFILAVPDLSPVEGSNPITFTIFTSDTLDPTPSQTFLVGVDTVPPTASITSPGASTVWQAGGPAVVSWIMTETNSGPAPTQVWFRTGPAADPLLITTTTDNHANWTVPSTITAVSNQAQVELKLSDLAGNTGAAESPTFAINTPVTWYVYLPLLMRPNCTYMLPDCYEPNNNFNTAYGPLSLNTIYTATTDQTFDPYDFYTVTLASKKRYTLTVSLALTKTSSLAFYLYYTPVITLPLASMYAPKVFIYTPTLSGTFYLLEYAFSTTVPTSYTFKVGR